MKTIGIKENLLYNILYEFIRLLVPLLTTPYVSRILRSEGIGLYTLSNTYAQYFVLFAGLGFSIYAAREMAYVSDDRKELRNLFWEIFIARASLVILATIIYIVVFFVAEVKSELSYKLCIIYLIASLFDISYYYKAIENFRIIAIRNIFIKLLSLIAIFILIKRAKDVWLYVIILASAEFVGQAVMLLSLDKVIFTKPIINLANIKKHCITSISLFLPTLAIQMYTMLDKLMIGEICGESEAGYYENGQKMVRLVSTIASAIVSVSAPRMAFYYAKKAKSEFQSHYRKVFKVVSFLVFPMFVGLITIARNFSSWYYGSNFKGIEILVMAGAVLIVSLGWSGILGNLILIPTGNQKYFTISVYVGATLNVVINFILIPRMGALGAIIASDVGEIVGMVLMFYFSNKKFKVISEMGSSLKYLCASLIMGAIISIFGRYFSYGIASTAMLVLVGGISYVIIMWVLHDEVYKDGCEILKSGIRKIKR